MNTNIIKNQLMRVKQSLITLFLLLTLSLNFACVDSPDNMQVISDNPFGVGIIVFNSVPSLLFGNGIDQDTIKINTGLIPDGSSIDARITGTNLESNVAGCVLSGSTNIVNGMATFDFLSPIFIGNPGQIENVNLAVDIVIPGDDTPDTTVTDFVSLLINAVSITPPGDGDVTPLPLDNPFIQFIDFIFTTTGIPPTAQEPSIVAECMASNPDLGFIDNTQINGNASTTPVLGTTETGRFITKYFINNGTLGGNQLITCMITLPNPQDIDPGCPNVPLNKRKVTAELLLLHNPADLTVPNSVTCTPNPITGGNDGVCICNGTNASGLEICISSPGPDVLIDACGTGDVNGTVVIPFDTNVVPEQVINPVICEIPDGFFFAQTNVTVNPGVVNSLNCEPNPVQSDAALGDPENETVCTCSTNSPFSPICFETVSGAGELNFPGGDPFCTTADGNGNAIMIPTVDGGIIEDVDNIIQCCIDAGDDGTCDEDQNAQETVTITPFVPPVTSISCTAQQTTIGPDGSTFIDIEIDGFPFAQEVCAQIEIDSEDDVILGAVDEDPEVDCSITDANGQASILFDGPDTIALQRDVTVRCFPDTTDDDLFTAGEISAIEVVTLDPNAGPAPVEIACNVDTSPIGPGDTTLLTATLNNAGVGSNVCFQFFTDTNPGSVLDDGNAGDDPVGSVCSQTNIANQAFANFTADGNILIDDTATVTCCADQDGPADGCDFDDPQTNVNIEVDVPAISIACSPQVNPIGPNDDTFINIQTTGVAPDDGMGDDEDVCAEIIIDTSPSSTITAGCGIVDALGNASVQFTGGDVGVLDIATVRCFVDNGTENDMFDAGEIFVTTQVTVDPNAAPAPVQIACEAVPSTVVPGDDAQLTATVMNAAPGQSVCFDFASNTSPASDLSDANESNETEVCSDTNGGNQAFATFSANAGIIGLDTATIGCCFNDNGNSDACDPEEITAFVAVNVDPPPPSIISIAAPAGTFPDNDVADDDRFITVTTNVPVPAGTDICMFKIAENGMDPGVTNNDGDTATDLQTFPNDITEGDDVVCLTTLDASGQIVGMFQMLTPDGETAGDNVTIVACIDQLSDGFCSAGDPLSNSLVFTIIE